MASLLFRLKFSILANVLNVDLLSKWAKQFLIYTEKIRLFFIRLVASLCPK